MKKHWEYATAPGVSVGLMICTACSKKIETGDFRYRETEEAYLPQHRSCSATDEGWAVVDAKRLAESKRGERQLTEKEIAELREALVEGEAFDLVDLDALANQARRALPPSPQTAEREGWLTRERLLKLCPDEVDIRQGSIRINLPEFWAMRDMAIYAHRHRPTGEEANPHAALACIETILEDSKGPGVVSRELIRFEALRAKAALAAPAPVQGDLLQKVLKAVDDEPELPGEPPEGYWETVDAHAKEYGRAEAQRVLVRLTKRGIRERIIAALAPPAEDGEKGKGRA